MPKVNFNETPSLPLVIVNPTSAGGATGEGWARTASDLRTHFGAFNCAFTKAAGDARRIAREEAQAGRKLIIACGGDGTISETAHGIIESGASYAELGILPSGTGGDFRRTLNIPTRSADAALTLREGATRTIDVIRVTYRNDANEEATRYCINVASFGMSEAVINRVKRNANTWLPSNNARLLGGQISFASAALRATLAFERLHVRIQNDEHAERRLTVANLCVANARYFGGGMKIAPEAKLNDGLLDIVVIGDLSATKILSNAYRLYLGTHLGIEHVYHTRARRVTTEAVDSQKTVKIEIDGELTGDLPATFEIVPRALRVRCPK